jgi:DNA repair photolyase
MVKTNLPELLRHELSRSGWRHETVAVGTATDPYQPIEGKYRITRRCLEVFADSYTPVGLVTKGTMAVRDVDVLAELSNRAGCTVCFSVTTLDRDTWSRLEPGTPPPRQRLRAVERLVARGVNAGVLLAPVVPGITDGRANLEEVAREAAAHGARFLGTNVLYLKAGTKEHFMEFLEQLYPELTQAYRNIYPASYAPRKLQDRVRLRVQEFKVKYGLEDLDEANKAASPALGQKTLTLA